MTTVCSVCENSYNTTDKKPLLLPCGHSFCKICLLKIPASGKICFLCRAPWKCNVERLPMCYQLLPDETSASASPDTSKLNQPNSCQQHSYALEFWCVTCCRELCKKCLFEEHKGCETLITDDVLKKQDGFLADAAIFLRKKTAANLRNLRGLIVRNSRDLERVTKFQDVVASSIILLKDEQSTLDCSRAANQEILRCLESYDTSALRVAQKRSVMRMATTSFIRSQNEARLTAEQRMKIKALCSFGSNFYMPMQPPSEDSVWHKIKEFFSLERVTDIFSLERVTDIFSLERMTGIYSMERITDNSSLERIIDISYLERVKGIFSGEGFILGLGLVGICYYHYSKK